MSDVLQQFSAYRTAQQRLDPAKRELADAQAALAADVERHEIAIECASALQAEIQDLRERIADLAAKRAGVPTGDVDPKLQGRVAELQREIRDLAAVAEPDASELAELKAALSEV